jgi:hypothetical protein
MKCTEVAKGVRDVAGLNKALKGATPPFDVAGIGSDAKSKTHVWLNDRETKDPTPYVMAWVDPPPKSLLRTPP